MERRPGPGALPDPDSIRIPDDLSALEADMWALRAEMAAARRRDRRRGRSAPGRLVLARFGPLIFGSLLLVAFLGSLAGMVRSTATAPAQATQLATSQVPDGSVGGLLPQAVVEVNGAPLSLRDVRPAAVLWVPTSGADAELLDSLLLQASSYGVPLVVAGPPEREEVLAETAQQTGLGRVAVLVDPGSQLLDSLAPAPQDGPVLLLVGIDGRIHEIVEDPAPSVRLEASLSRMAAGEAPAP
jgi:hypothetical protein